MVHHGSTFREKAHCSLLNVAIVWQCRKRLSDLYASARRQIATFWRRAHAQHHTTILADIHSTSDRHVISGSTAQCLTLSNGRPPKSLDQHSRVFALTDRSKWSETHCLNRAQRRIAQGVSSSNKAKNSSFVVCDRGVYKDPTTCQFAANLFRKDRDSKPSKINCLARVLPVSNSVSIGKLMEETDDNGRARECHLFSRFFFFAVLPPNHANPPRCI